MSDQDPRTSDVLDSLEEYLLFVLVFSLPLQAFALLPFASVTVTKVGGAILIFSVMVRRVIRWRTPFVSTGLGGAIALFAITCGLSTLFSTDPGASRAALITLVQYMFLFYAVAAVASRSATQFLIPRVFVAAAAISGGGAMLAYAGRIVPPSVDLMVPHLNVRRVCFGLLDSNEQGMLFVFAAAFLLFETGLWRGVAKATHPLRALELILICFGILLTFSRTAWLVLVALIVLRGVTTRQRFQFASVAIVLGVVILGTLFALKPDIIDSIRRRTVEVFQTSDASMASRIAINVSAVEAASRGGLFGHGLATVDPLSINTFRDPLGNRIGVTVHNVPLIFWVETGLAGVLAYLWLWSSLIAAIIAARNAGGVFKERVDAYAVIALSYGAFSLLMPFIYRSSLAILLGCACGVFTSASLNPGKEDIR